MAAVLLVVLSAAVTTGVLLFRVASIANSIDEKAEKIAKSGRGINIATDSAIQLRRTNARASSIRDNAEPLLPGDLRAINDAAGDVNGVAESIDSHVGTVAATAREIDSVAAEIKVTAEGIESEVAAILDVAELIDRDVALINENLDDTIAVVRTIKSDTGNILTLATAAHQTTACIDQKLGGRAGADGHCERGG